MGHKSARILYCGASLLALSLGFLCYYCFRNSDQLFFQMFNIQITRRPVHLPDGFWPDFINYNLCDGLWVLSGILFIRCMWFNYPAAGNYYIIAFFGIALLLELLQLTTFVPGTFDILDILTMGSFTLSEYCINKIFTKRRSLKWVKKVG